MNDEELWHCMHLARKEAKKELWERIKKSMIKQNQIFETENDDIELDVWLLGELSFVEFEKEMGD